MLSIRTGIKRICALSLCVSLILSVSVFASGRNLTDTWENRLDDFYATSELLDASVYDLISAMQSGRTTSEEITGMYLRRIENYDKALGINSFITVNENALEEARNADEARRNGASGRLLGVPVIVGDSIDVEGLPTTNGSSSALGNIASADSVVVRRLRDEGAVIIGKGNLSENTDNENTTRSSAGGTVHNPYDISRTPAGSSAGTAVAVTCNFAAFGIAVETGASVRLPASFAGIYGLRTSYGLVPRSGSVLPNGSEDVIGILARFPSDITLVLDIISGSNESDGASAGASELIPTVGYTVPSDGEASFAGIRIGFLSNSFGYYVDEEGRAFDYPDELSSEVRGMLDNALATFTENGAELVDLSATLTEEYLSRVSGSGGSLYRRVISDIMEEYEVDAIAYVSSLSTPEQESRAYGDSYNPADYSHHLSSHLGLPEIVVPMKYPDTEVGTVVGLSLVGGYGKDDILLSVAASYYELSDSFTVPVAVPALPDENLKKLGEDVVSAAEKLLSDSDMSPESRELLTSAAETLRVSSMDEREGAEKISVSTYRTLVYDLCILLDTAELIVSPAPIKNIHTLRFLIQRYRGIVSVSSVSVLLFVFAMLLARPGRKTERQRFAVIPRSGSADAANMSLPDRLRIAAENLREQRRLLKEARKALRSRDITSRDIASKAKGDRASGRAGLVSRFEATAVQTAGPGAFGKTETGKDSSGEKRISTEAWADTLRRLRENLKSFIGVISRPFTNMITSMQSFEMTERTSLIEKISQRRNSKREKKQLFSAENTSSAPKQGLGEMLSARAERNKARRESAEQQRKLDDARRAEERAERRRVLSEKEELDKRAKEEKRAQKAAAAAARAETRKAYAVERRQRFSSIVSGFRNTTLGRFKFFSDSLMRYRRNVEVACEAKAEEKRQQKEQRIAEEAIRRRIKNAEKVDARERLLAQKTAENERAEAEKARREQEKREKEERRLASREKAAALRAEKEIAEREARKERRAVAAESRKAAAAARKAAVRSFFGYIHAQITKLKSSLEKSAAERRRIRDEAIKQRRAAETLRVMEKQQKKEKKLREIQSRREKQEAAQAERKLLRERYEQRRIQETRAFNAEKAVLQKERAAASVLKKQQRAEKRAAFISSIKAVFTRLEEERNLRRSEKTARKEQASITKAAEEQYRILQKNKKKEAQQEQKTAVAALRASQKAEERKLKEERQIEKKAAAVFREEQRKQKAAARRERAREAITVFFTSIKERAEERRVRKAEELFRRNSELRARKRQLEELKAERDRLAEANRQFVIAEQEKKEQQKQARKDAEAAYRAMVDRRISEQIEVLEAQSAQRMEEQLEIKRRKEEKQRERAAQREAKENKRREERLRLQQEREAMQQAKELAESQRREKEKQLKEEKKAELARLDFEKNKDKIIKAQRREIKQAERAENRRVAKQETAAKRYENRMLKRKKISIFLRELPSRVALVPSRLAESIGKKRESIRQFVAESRARDAESAAKLSAIRAVEEERRSNKLLADEKIRAEKKENIERIKAEKKEAAAVAARIKKQETAEKKAKAAREKAARAETRTAKREASKAASAARANAVKSAVKGAFSAIAGWVSGVFNTTENWIKRVVMLISGAVMFVLMIPVRMFKALLDVPGRIASYFKAQREKGLARAENREYKAEQKRITKEKLSVAGQSNIVPSEGHSSVPVSGVTAEGSIRNLEKEAPFTFSQRSLRDLLRPVRFQMFIAAVSAVIQSAAIIAVPDLIAELIAGIKSLDIEKIPSRITIAFVIIISAIAVAQLLGKISLSSLLRKVSKEMRRIEFSIRRDRDRSVSMSDDIAALQDIAEAQYEYIFDIALVVFACIAACISNPFNAVIALLTMLNALLNRKNKDTRLSQCKSVEEAVSVREAVALDWAKKLRVNKLLGRGNDSYDNVRNAVLDVNIRTLSVKDVHTDSDTVLRSIAYVATIVSVVLPFILPMRAPGTCARYMLTAASVFVLIPVAVRSASDKFAILRKKKDLSRVISEKLTGTQVSGE